MKKYILLIFALFLIYSCSSEKKEPGKTESGTSSGMELLGAGATFPYPLYSKMFDEYHKINKS